MIYITLHRKQKIEKDEPHKNSRGELMYFVMVSSSCSIFGSRRVTVKRGEHDVIWKSSCTPE